MNNSVSRLFIFLILILCGFLTNGQDYPMLHYKADDGLPSNTVYQVYKDSKGYLWVATDKGIARYNGLKWEVFTTANGLPDNEIFFFYEDSRRRLWLGTLNGELCFYKNGVFHTVANTPFLRLPVTVSHTRYIKEEKDSSVSLKYNGKLVNIDNEKGTMFHIDKLSVPEGGAAIFSRKLNDNRYYTYTAVKSGLLSDTSGAVLQRRKIDSIVDFFLCDNNYYFLTTNSKLCDEQMNVVGSVPDFLKKKTLNSFGIYANDTFYFTNDGLYVNNTTHFLKGISVSSVVIDDEGSFWISTFKDGVYVLPAYYSRAIIYKNAFSGNVQYARAFSSRLLYIVDDNVFRFDSTRSQLLFRFDDEKLKSAFLIQPDYHCFKMTTERLTEVDDLLSGKPVVKKFNRYCYFPKEMVMLNDLLCVRTTNAVFRLDLKKLHSGFDRKDLDTSGRWERVYGMAAAPDGRLWFSRRDAMYVIDGDSTIELPLFNKRAFKQFAFIGDYLIGYTQRNELLVCTNVYKGMQTLEVRDHNCIWDRFYRLDDSHLLISTSNKYRVVTVDGRSGHHNFNVSVIEDPFIPLQAEFICSDTSTCYFFKNGSITAIPIASLYTAQTPPRLSFTALKAGKATFSVDSVVSLSYTDSRNLAIYFSTLSLSSKEVFYQYSISRNGVDNWRNLEGEQINLVNIGAGDYIVKVRARTISSRMGDPIMFQLQIAQPFWLSWWFISLLAGVVAYLVWWLSRRRTYRALSKKQKEHDTQVRFMKSEYKALNALMNPHFIFNTLNNVQSLVNSNDKLAANEYLRVFADLIRQNMHNISKELIPLSKEMELVNNYLLLEKLRFEDRLSYDISVDDDLHLAEVMVPPLIFQPLVENAIKHGVLQLATQAGHIHIRIYEEGNVLYMQVRDNGGGINTSIATKDPAHESYGLENIRKRIQQLSIIQNKQISLHIGEEVDSENGTQWTVASISMLSLS